MRQHLFDLSLWRPPPAPGSRESGTRGRGGGGTAGSRAPLPATELPGVFAYDYDEVYVVVVVVVVVIVVVVVVEVVLVVVVVVVVVAAVLLVGIACRSLVLPVVRVCGYTRRGWSKGAFEARDYCAASLPRLLYCNFTTVGRRCRSTRRACW